MKFSRREDIEAPAAAVFAAISDFPSIERTAMRRGIEVARTDGMDEPGAGMGWQIRAPVRGKTRDITLTLTDYRPEGGMILVAASSGMSADIGLEIVPLSPSRTRLQVGCDLRAATLTAKILLQSMKLAKAALDRRFADRVAEFGRRIEAQQPGTGRGRGKGQPRRGSAG